MAEGGDAVWDRLVADIRGGEGSSLMKAVQKRDDEMLQRLRAEREVVEGGLTKEAWESALAFADARGSTPLHWAISMGHRPWSFFLLQQVRFSSTARGRG